MGKGLSREQKAAQWATLFKRYDKDKSGELDEHEFLHLVRGSVRIPKGDNYGACSDDQV